MQYNFKRQKTKDKNLKSLKKIKTSYIVILYIHTYMHTYTDKNNKITD